MNSKIRRALISVSDKTGLVPFARALDRAGVEIISTGGTAKALREGGVPTRDLSDYTGFPEMLDGRVKTLHPKVHGGLLYLRGNRQHEEAVKSHGIEAIDLVVVNLYPFEETVAKPGVHFEEAIENIDIGGPSMLRSAAKNHESVTVVCEPSDYPRVIEQVEDQGGTSLELRRELAAKVFQRTGFYDQAIAQFLIQAIKPAKEKTEPTELPSTFKVGLPKAQSLRYGENPHQKAALYGRFDEFFQQIHGKELSYNNLLDLTAAADLISEFQEERPTVAILKHTNPCGVGQGGDLAEAWEKAFATDRQAPFGGIIVSNVRFNAPISKQVSEIFSEVIVAPDFDSAALEILQKKKNLRLIRMIQPCDDKVQFRSVSSHSLLVQERDERRLEKKDLKVVTDRAPSARELEAMLFGWRVVKHVKSNAIVYVSGDRTLGIGAGQMSRVDASRIAVWKAKEAGLSLQGSVVCSDAFFPFPDGLVAASEAGATAAIQPGGSVKDPEVIAAANQRGLAMAFTGVRHFRH